MKAVDVQAAAAMVADLAGRPCKPVNIRVWATRGHLTRHGRDHQRRGLYDPEELEKLAIAWRDGQPLPRPLASQAPSL